MDDIALDSVDKSGMHKIYDQWSELASNAYNNSVIDPDFKDVEHIIFAGMGGSGTIGDIFASILSKSKRHVSIVKGYKLPSTANENTLVITTSVSGNTSETLSILKQAHEINCKIIGFSSGGKMEMYCEKNKIKHCKIKLIHSPRASFPSFFYTIVKTLKDILDLDTEKILESIKELKKLQKEICSSNLSENNLALNLAREIDGIPIIYYPKGLKAAAIRFKNSLQENSKMHVITENIIEACHNGVVSWETPSNVMPILLEGIDDHEKTKERWELVKKFFEQNKIEYNEIISKKGNIITKMVNLIYLLDYISIYKAILTQIDPTPIKSIDYIKNQLKTE